MTTRTAWCAKCDGPVLCDERGCVACAEKREHDRLLRMNAPLQVSCAICGGTYGLHRDQIESGGPVYTVCANCDESEAKTIASSPPRYPLPPRKARGGTWQRKRYRPIDESEKEMTFRILQAIRHFDWVTPDVLASAMNIPPSDVNSLARNNFDVTISRIARQGFLRRIGAPMCFEYQITELGLARYENEIRRSVEAKRSIAA